MGGLKKNDFDIESNQSILPLQFLEFPSRDLVVLSALCRLEFWFLGGQVHLSN